LASEFGWTLSEIRQLLPSELHAIVQELRRQKAIKEYAEQRNQWAFLAAVISNNFIGLARALGSRSRDKSFTPDDFLNPEFKRFVTGQLQKQQEPDYSRHLEDAQQKGLQSVPRKG